MSISISEVIIGVLETTRSNISLVIKVSTKVNSIYDLCQAKNTNVELSHWSAKPILSTDQQRLGNILLYYPTVSNPRALQESFDCVKAFKHNNAFSSVGIFTWFTNPYLFFIFGMFLNQLDELLVIAHVCGFLFDIVRNR
jgi:hypothetical protein